VPDNKQAIRALAKERRKLLNRIAAMEAKTVMAMMRQGCARMGQGARRAIQSVTAASLTFCSTSTVLAQQDGLDSHKANAPQVEQNARGYHMWRLLS
jgi:hypothetical protein